MKTLDPMLMLIGRVFISAIFILAGLQKIATISATQAYMQSEGLPGYLIYPTILIEVLGGLAILVGYQTRIAAWVLGIFCVLTALIFHLDPSSQAQMQHLMKNFAIAGGFLFLVVHGPGRLSVEGKKRKT